MKIHLTIFLFFIALKSLSAQENKPQPPTENLQLEEIIDDEDEVHIIVQNNAEYPGGLLNFRKEFKIYFETPEIEENRIKVPVVFIIEKDGTISDIKVYNDPGYDIQERVIKAFEKMQTWKPANNNKQPVRSQFTLPITLEKIRDNSTAN